MVFLLAIIGMLCWGIAPVFVKIGIKDINPIVGLSIRTFFTAGFIISWMIIDGSIGQIKNVSTGTIIILIIEAVLATLIGDLAYFTAIKKGSVSLVTVIMSSSPLVTIICAVIFLGEKITLFKLFGAFLVIAGIIIVV